MQYRLSARGNFSEHAATLYEAAENKSLFIFDCIEFYVKYHEQIHTLTKVLDSLTQQTSLVHQIEQLSHQIHELRVLGFAVHSNAETSDVQIEPEPEVGLSNDEEFQVTQIQSTLGAFLGDDDDED